MSLPVLLCSWLLLAAAPAAAAPCRCAAADDAEQRQPYFFALGDWGRGGSAPQRAVAARMADVAQAVAAAPAFVLSTGDNVYPSGVSGPDDRRFKASFSDVYASPPLRTAPWYAVLGNHDVRTDRGRGQAGEPLASDSRWFLRLGAVTPRLGLLAGRLDLFLLDTNRGADQLRPALQAALRDPAARAPWRVVAGHHPVFSYGEHCDGQGDGGGCAKMRWLPDVLRRGGVRVYLSGHDHDLQVLRAPDDPVLYVVTGAGSAVRAGEFEGVATDPAVASAEFMRAAPGFVRVQVAEDQLTVAVHTTADGGAEPARVVQLPL